MTRSRNFYLLLALCALLLGAVGLAQGPRGTAPAGPMVWNAYMFNNSTIALEVPAGLVSSFTPSGDITITRIQAVSGEGPRVRFSFTSERQLERCSIKPSIRVTNGTVSYALPFSEPERLLEKVSTDSGPLDLRFPANNRIDLIVLPGAPLDYNNFCFIGNVNFTVQYRTH